MDIILFFFYIRGYKIVHTQRTQDDDTIYGCAYNKRWRNAWNKKKYVFIFFAVSQPSASGQ